MKTINSISELRSLVAEDEVVYVRWSRGLDYDRKMGGMSTDYISGETHGGLSCVPLQPGQVADDLVANALNEYRFLRIKDGEIYGWLARATCVGRDSDGATLIDAGNAEVIGRLSDEMIVRLRRYSSAFLAYDDLYRRLPLMERIKLTAPQPKDFDLV